MISHFTISTRPLKGNDQCSRPFETMTLETLFKPYVEGDFNPFDTC